MKKIYYSLISAALLFVGCTQDFNEPAPVIPAPNDAIAINIGGSIDQVPTTRVNDEGFCDGDGIGVYVVNYQDGVQGTLLDEGNQVDNVRYVYNESENKWTPDYPVYYYDKVTPVDIVGYYPYTTNISVNAYSFEVAKDQYTDANNGLMGGYEASDFLWGVAEGISPTSSGSFTKSSTIVDDLPDLVRFNLLKVCTVLVPPSFLSTNIVCNNGSSKPVWYFSATINMRY